MSTDTIIDNKDVKSLYNLPTEVKFCNKCTISNQRPRISFDDNGVCSACNYADFKKNIEWNRREQELVKLLDEHRSKNGNYDVLVPVSGGKDGCFVAHQLKYKYGMNPLTVTWAPHLSTEIGRQNLEKFIDSGFDNIYGRPAGDIHRLMTKLSFMVMGDPFQPFIYGQQNFPLKIAVKYGISLIMYGENGEVEYGGDMKNAFRPTREITDHDKHFYSGIPPETWLKYGITEKDMFSYLPPSHNDVVKNSTEIHYFGYYKFWDPQENYYYCREHTGFRPNPERTEGTYSKYASLDDQLDSFHYYLALIKFGLGRTTSDTAHEIRDGKITRDEGIALIRKYDSESPNRYLQTFLDYCDISEDDYWQVIDSWRADHIWVKQGDQWKIRHPIWESEQAIPLKRSA